MNPDKDTKDTSAPKAESPKKAAPAPAGRVFDVSRPGKAAASPTSRPVILGHKPEAQNSQLTVSGIGEATSPLPAKRKMIQIVPSGDSATPAEEQGDPEQASGAPDPTTSSFQAKTSLLHAADKPEPAATDNEKEALAAAALDATTTAPHVFEDKGPERISTGKIKIQPLSQSESHAAVDKSQTVAEAVKAMEASEPAAPSESDPTPEADTSAAASAAPEETKPEEEAPAVLSSAPLDTTDAPTAQASAGSAADPAAQSPMQGEASIPAPEEEIEPLFDKSGIVVSSHEHHHRSAWKTLLLIALILVLAVIALDIALDLGVLNLPGLPRSHYF